MLDRDLWVRTAMNYVMTNTTSWDDVDDVSDKYYLMDYSDHELEGEGLFWIGDRAYGKLRAICEYLFETWDYQKEAERLGWNIDSDDAPQTAIQNVVTGHRYITNVDVSDFVVTDHLYRPAADGSELLITDYEELLRWMGVDRRALVKWTNISGWGGIGKYSVTPYELEIFSRLTDICPDENLYAQVAFYVLDRSLDNRYLHKYLVVDMDKHLTWFLDNLHLDLGELWDAEF